MIAISDYFQKLTENFFSVGRMYTLILLVTPGVKRVNITFSLEYASWYLLRCLVKGSTC